MVLCFAYYEILYVHTVQKQGIFIMFTKEELQIISNYVKICLPLFIK